MNIYDFDGTIYDGDSTVDFYKFIMKRHPLSLRHIPSFVLATLKHKRGKYTTTRWKSCFFMFLKDIDDVTGEVKTFWEKNMKKIYPWYLKQKRSDDVIISASPEFLLKLPCQQLQTDRLIASRVDPHTGEFQGLNCKGSEKVKRFRELFPTEQIDSFYSDSVSDLPMAKLARQAYLIKNGNIIPWDIERGDK